MNIQKHNGHKSEVVKDDIAGSADPKPIPMARPVHLENDIKTLSTEDITVVSNKNLCEILTPEPPVKYKVLDTVGKGGMKVILKVRDKDTLRNVAMAVISEKKKSDAANINNFIKEARIAANLEHPNIIPVYDMGVSNLGNPYFTMKLIGGENLSYIIERLSEGDPDYIATFTLPHLLQIFQKICDAIAFAHSKGVIHLDLSPANIRVGDFGEVLVLDWGLAKLIEEGGEETVSEEENESGFSESKSENSIIDKTLQQSSGWRCSQPELTFTAKPLRDNGELSFIESKHTADGIAKGTPGYMSPEQAMGRNRERDKRTDIFALGAILYSMLTYQRAINGTNTTQMMKNTVIGNFIPLYSKPGCIIPKALKAVVMKAMSILPGDRYQSVEELKKDIDAFSVGFATSAERAGYLTRFWLFMKRHKRERAVALSLLFLFFVFFGFSRYYQHVQRLENYRILLSDAQRYEKNKDYGSALDLLQKARMLYDKDEIKQKMVKLLIENAQLLIDRANWAAAATQLEKASALSPENPEIRRLMPLALGEGFLSIESNINGILKEHFVDENFQFILDSPHSNQLKVKVHGSVPIKELRMEDGFHYLYLETKFNGKIYLPTKITRGQKTDINIPCSEIPDGFVYIHGGEFLYGDEKTVTNGVVGKRTVYVPGFFMKKYPVSEEEYLKFLHSKAYGTVMTQVLTEYGLAVHDIDPKAQDALGLKPMKYRPGSSNLLAVGVSYYEALAYAKWRGGRLPTVYEWEKAARGIDGRIFSTGNLISAPTLFNFPETYLSPYGCRDLTGVLWQWTSTPDPTMPNRKIVKGGTAISNIFNIQPSTWKDREPKLKYIDVGIIICRDL